MHFKPPAFIIPAAPPQLGSTAPRLLLLVNVHISHATLRLLLRSAVPSRPSRLAPPAPFPHLTPPPPPDRLPRPPASLPAVRALRLAASIPSSGSPGADGCRADLRLLGRNSGE
ncbi:hypothetical protein PVAP13_4NG184800 [Panicum virgatum]|uniref:Uncharacterized protein n=1 Tax=Panicum virgatum TaxID=38727 RepID=A0A8T0TDN4_PANVG|nr:hypothetical protein PVAP13_4NG184800 [Panicum virgatum]